MVINLDRGRKGIQFHGGRRLEPDSLEAVMNLYGLQGRSSRKGGGVETIDDASGSRDGYVTSGHGTVSLRG